jgi:hypothetical protein
MRLGTLLEKGSGFDDCWSLMAIAVHMREAERGAYQQFETILTRPEPELKFVDFDDVPLEQDWQDEDEEEVLDEFHYLRRQTSYLLWDLMPSEWERGGIHPYRGRVTVLQLTRELYQHDLEHLWQARRMVEAVASR